jgi:galactose mutarotase-like enzyme
MIKFEHMADTAYELKAIPGDLLRIHSLGAKVELVLQNETILGSFVRGDGKNGTTHPCTPIFGPDRRKLYGLSQHGKMRGEECSVREEGNEIIISHLITDTGYPEGMKVEQRMSMANGEFTFQMTHNNTGDKEAAVNVGEHCYFDAPEGFAGATINGKDITELITNNYDGIAIELLEKNKIQIPGKPIYELSQRGLSKAVVWVGKNPDTKEIDKNYICIEPVEEDPFGDFFGSSESLISPGERRSVAFRLRISE